MNHYRRVKYQRAHLGKKIDELREELDRLYEMIDSMEIKDCLSLKGMKEVIIAPEWVRQEIKVMKDAEKEKRLIPA